MKKMITTKFGSFKNKKELFEQMVKKVVTEYKNSGYTPTCFSVFQDQSRSICYEIVTSLIADGISFSNAKTDHYHWSMYKLQRDAYYNVIESM